jgi:multidrug transporter EmrE-like cation transporter
MMYGYLIIALALNSLANVLLKFAAIGQNGASLRALVTNPFAIIGVTLFASNVYFYIQALRVLPISLVYPTMTAVSFIIISVFAVFAFKEPFSLTTLLGHIVIVLGVVLVTAR